MRKLAHLSALLFASRALSPCIPDGIANTQPVSLLVLDGKSGKPMANQRVLIFTGASEREAESHGQHVVVHTDERGLATLRLRQQKQRYLQLFADGRVMCYPNPNRTTFDAADIASKGVLARNSCGDSKIDPSAGKLVVFVRKPSFNEKMKW